MGIPITHRDHASAVALITGQQQSDAANEIDWASLARFPGTIVFYMGVTTVAKWSNQLIGAGKAPDTPAAIIRRCTWSDQSVYRCRLDEVADLLTPSTKMRPPVIVIIGAVAALGKDFDWFSSRPLMGCGVLITRAAEQSDNLAERLRALGAEVYLQPVIEVVEPSDTEAIDKAVQELADKKYDGVTFSSTNGVDGLLNCVNRLGFDSRIFANTKIAVVGAHTAERLNRFGLRADIVPSKFSANDLLNALPQQMAGQRWLVTCTNRSRDTLARGLTERGVRVNGIVVYETRNVERLKPGVESALRTGRIHWVTVTSGAIAENAHALLKEFTGNIKPISLSDSISARLNELQWPPAAQAAEHSIASLIDALQKVIGTN